MRGARSVVAVWVALVILFCGVNCIAACASTSCSDHRMAANTSLPPCHRHHQPSESNKCAQAPLQVETIRAASQQQMLVDIGPVLLADVVCLTPVLQTEVCSQTIGDPPAERRTPFRAVLRI